MKIIVDELPENSNKCLFAIRGEGLCDGLLPNCLLKCNEYAWLKGYVQFTYKPNIYTCNLDAGQECPFLKQADKEITEEK